MASRLFEIRDQLGEKLRDVPGFMSVGVGQEKGKTVLIVSVDQSKFQGVAPPSFAGYSVTVQDFGRAIGYTA
jgi:hypothetical protein